MKSFWLRRISVISFFPVTAAMAAPEPAGPANLTGWGLTPPPGVEDALAVAATRDAGLAIRADGSLLAWGASGVTNLPPAATNVAALAAGNTHVLAQRGDGSVLAWGAGSAALLTVPAAATNVTALAAGSSFNLALRADGAVVGWGDYATSNALPAEVTGLKALAATALHAWALRADGRVVGWHARTFQPVIVPAVATNLTAIAARDDLALFLRGDGRVLGFNPVSGGLTIYAPTNVTRLSARGFAAAGLTAAGEFVALGIGAASPPPGTPPLFDLAAAAAHGEALTLAPVFTRQPQPVEALPGRDARFEATTTGPQPVTLEWFGPDGGAPLAAGNILVVPNVQPASEGDYFAVARNHHGASTSAPAALIIPSVPVIAVEPADAEQLAGFPIQLELAYEPNGLPLLQWFHEGTPEPGATSAALRLPAVNVAAAGRWWCIITNLAGGVTSRVAQVTVLSGALGHPRYRPGAGFEFTLNPGPDIEVFLEYSADLEIWEPWRPVTGPGPQVILDSDATNVTHRTYRWTWP
ncbi:MAG: hypothetical protein ACKVYV_02340 [Limisphaerales bacterium]